MIRTRTYQCFDVVSKASHNLEGIARFEHISGNLLLELLDPVQQPLAIGCQTIFVQMVDIGMVCILTTFVIGIECLDCTETSAMT